MNRRQVLMAGLLAVVLAGMPLLNVEAAKMTETVMIELIHSLRDIVLKAIDSVFAE